MRRQRGFMLIVGLLLVLGLATSLFLTAQQTAAVQRAERAIAEPRAAAGAREALLAYALAGGSNDEPGALPCPDVNGDGVSNGTACQGENFYLGRLPRATLDIDPDALYGSDEIWYVVDHDFVDWDPPDRLNTGSSSDLVVNGGGDFPAALIMARDPLAGQNRTAGDAAEFLEGENIDGDEEFASCDSDTCNDRVIGLTRGELLGLVRKRLLGTIRDALTAFAAVNGHYPYAAPLGEPNGACSSGELRGSLPVASGDCGSDYLDALPGWVTGNDWHRWVYYEVADSCSPGGAGCDATAPDLLTLNDQTHRAVVLATVGAPLVSAAKGSMQDRSGTPPIPVEEYLDSPENVDADAVFDDPENDAGENDRLRALPVP